MTRQQNGGIEVPYNYEIIQIVAFKKLKDGAILQQSNSVSEHRISTRSFSPTTIIHMVYEQVWRASVACDVLSTILKINITCIHCLC